MPFMPTRRELLTSTTLAMFASLLGGARPAGATGAAGQRQASPSPRGIVKPPRLKAGDTVGLVIPSSAQWDPGAIDILDDHLKPLGVPAYSGAMIGHVDRQFTLPLGVQVELDAVAGTITMLESAVA